jgi:hypothetical protein
MGTTKPTKKTDTTGKPNSSPKKSTRTKKSIAMAKNLVGNYTPISHHIYHDGHSYRVRVCIDGTRYTQSFSSKRKAFEFRKSILSK